VLDQCSLEFKAGNALHTDNIIGEAMRLPADGVGTVDCEYVDPLALAIPAAAGAGARACSPVVPSAGSDDLLSHMCDRAVVWGRHRREPNNDLTSVIY